MNKKYEPKKFEQIINKKWIDTEVFSKHDKTKEPFTIILPPPNVTGKLHLGHAWDGFIQDTMIRFNKLNGKDVLFIPGMDHAGIATQAKVEQRIWKEEGLKKSDIGRKKFLEKVWNWKEDYATIIRKQWNKLGLALDYKKERFTMDDGLIEAVQKVFIKMYRDGLIYKGIRAINWDPVLETTISNIEVISKETNSTMFYFKYPIKNSDKFVEIATTRPETLFSDVAIAINPNDETTAWIKNKTIINPLSKKELIVFTDEKIEIGKGTGVMKVSAHSEMDIDMINKRDNLEVIETIDKQGNLNELTGKYNGINRKKARLMIASEMEELGFLIKKETIRNIVGYSERTGEPVETLVSSQWFIKMESLAQKLLNSLNSKDKVIFHPHRFEDVLRKWMENIHDWTISRQLWWGHRIPAWYKDDELKIQLKSPGEGWVQDEDVLDTWFSSGIAPFSFLGWPENLENVEHYYPTSLLVTGYDIIFFWVARMYFQGLDFMKKVPFKEVLIHGLIRSSDGKKMSKSLGNGIDPMDVIKKYGSDSLRWFLLTNSTPGNDIRYSVKKIESSWNLNNKIWNISRFILEEMNESQYKMTESDKWIKAKFEILKNFVKEKILKYDFTLIGKEINNFIYKDLSSSYIEMSKETQNQKFAKNLLKDLLVFLHPWLPFITDKIYSLFNNGELFDNIIIYSNHKFDTKEIDLTLSIIESIKEYKTFKEIKHSKHIKFSSNKELSKLQKQLILKFTSAKYDNNLKNGAKIQSSSFILIIEMTEEDIKKEKERVFTRINKLKEEIKRARGMLLNESFISKAPEEKIILERKKLIEFEKELDILNK
ncbi:MAG: valine--tRNA ligase [Mollicutes bacterium PWAP]|nr:valine--tRNA ligase [Mollicutes bacterium PWAP]